MKQGRRETSIIFKIEKAAATPEEISSLQTLTSIDLSKMGVVVPIEAANTVLDRHGEKIGADVLQKFANDINEGSIPALFAHDRKMPIGAIFGASLGTKSSGETALMAYMAIESDATLPDQPGAYIYKRVANRTLTDVSIGFVALFKWVDAADGAKGHLLAYYNQSRPEDCELYEISLLPKGAQRGAMVKGENRNNNINTMSHTVSLRVGASQTLQLKAVVAEGGEVELRGAAELEAAIKALEDAHAAEKAALETKVSALTQEIEDARKPHEADVINLQKGILPESAHYTADTIKELPLSKLQTLAKELEEKSVADTSKNARKTKYESPYFQDEH